MANIRLKEYRVERGEDDEPSYAVFILSEPPSPSWIVAFEACLAKHSNTAVVVSDHIVRTPLPPPVAIARLVQITQRCIEETNLLEGC